MKSHISPPPPADLKPPPKVADAAKRPWFPPTIRTLSLAKLTSQSNFSSHMVGDEMTNDSYFQSS